MNSTAVAIPNLDRPSAFFVETFPQMDRNEQALSRTIYQQLALGEPLSLARLANMQKQTVHAIKETLKQWGGVFYNDTGDIIGFWGIAVTQTPHRMQVHGKTSYAWCAWDTLFVPELVGTTAQVTSTCAATQETIHLTVTPQGIRATQPDLWLSFLLPEKKAVQENVTTSFCHYVHFFSSRAAGDSWTTQHEDTFLLTLDEAFEVGKKVNATRYAVVL